jgi:hypothetical protein
VLSGNRPEEIAAAGNAATKGTNNTNDDMNLNNVKVAIKRGLHRTLSSLFSMQQPQSDEISVPSGKRNFKGRRVSYNYVQEVPWAFDILETWNEEQPW